MSESLIERITQNKSESLITQIALIWLIKENKAGKRESVKSINQITPMEQKNV